VSPENYFPITKFVCDKYMAVLHGSCNKYLNYKNTSSNTAVYISI